MKINIRTIKFNESEDLKEYIHDKIGKISQHHPYIIRVDVILKEGAKNNPTNKWCELYVSLRGENKFVKKNSMSYEESISKAVSAMEKVLQKFKK